MLQAIADLSGLCLERTATAQVTALGAGSLAGLGTALWDQAALARLPVRPDRAVRPSLPADGRDAARNAWRELFAEVQPAGTAS